MAKPVSRQQLIDFCLRELGSPVTQINVAVEQIEDRIDDALQYFSEFHSDGIERTFVSHTLTQIDIDNEFVTLPNTITSVLRVLPQRSSFAGSSLFDIRFHIALDTLSDLQNLDMVGFTQTKSYLNLINQQFNPENPIRFRRYKNELRIDTDWSREFVVGEILLIEVYIPIDDVTNIEIYNDLWLKRYATSLIKKQWGNNTKKFGDIQLPGGITLKGQDIYNEALDEIEKLEIQIRDSFEEQPFGFIG